MPRGNKKYQASIRMPESMWKDVVEASARSGISAMEYMRRAIQKELDHDKDHDKKGKDEPLLTEEQTRSLITEQTQSLLRDQEKGLREELNTYMDTAIHNLRKEIRDENAVEIKELRGLLAEQQKTINILLRMIPKEK